MNKILSINIILLLLISSIFGFSQNFEYNGRINIILKNCIKGDSIDIILYSNNMLIKELCNPFEENYDFKSYSIDIKVGQYDVLVQSKNFPLILYKDVIIKDRKELFLIIDYSKIDSTNRRLQLRKFNKKIEFPTH